MKIIIMNKGWVVVKKQEMTKVWIDDKFVPVTIVKIIPQEIVRYKNQEKDWYSAVVIGLDKKEKQSKKWTKTVYADMVEFKVDDEYTQKNQITNVIDLDTIQWAEFVDVTWISKWKGFQWMVKRCHAKGMWATHGHKFTRTWWSKGNRKPRRTLKWHPHAGHMWAERITLKKIKVIDSFVRENENLIVLKWSLPGAYNGMLKLVIN